MKHKHILYFIMALIVLASCNDDDPVKPVTPPNPCAGKHPVSADFDMYESYFGVNKAIESNDTLSYNCILVLKAKYDCDYYEWQIEGDTTKYYTKNKTISFDDPIGTVRVRLITKGKPNLTCFPDDDGVDTVIKTVTVEPFINSGIVGKFRGAHLDSPLDSFDIEIRANEIGLNAYDLQIQNFPRGKYDTTFSKTSSQWTLLSFYNSIYITYRAGILMPEGWIVYDPKTNKIRIDYTLSDTTSTDPHARKAYIYEGIRIGEN